MTNEKPNFPNTKILAEIESGDSLHISARRDPSDREGYLIEYIDRNGKSKSSFLKKYQGGESFLKRTVGLHDIVICSAIRELKEALK